MSRGGVQALARLESDRERLGGELARAGVRADGAGERGYSTARAPFREDLAACIETPWEERMKCPSR
jgi:hypothetical protein